MRKIDEQHQRLTEKERQERSTHLQRTMWLLVHASGCADPHCTSSNCAKVKGLFNHALTCPKKIAGGCPYCRRMWALLQAHAKTCTASECPVPRCRWAGRCELCVWSGEGGLPGCKGVAFKRAQDSACGLAVGGPRFGHGLYVCPARIILIHGSWKWERKLRRTGAVFASFVI